MPPALSSPADLSRRSLTRALASAPVIAAVGMAVSANSATAAPFSRVPVSTSGAAEESRFTPYKTQMTAAKAPVKLGSTWTFDMPAMSSPPEPRRTEVWWALDKQAVSYGEGDVASYMADVSFDLGAAADAADHWHCLWQLHGPTNGTWSGPAMCLGVIGGYLRMWGGHGHPKHDYRDNYYYWSIPLVRVSNRTKYRVKVQSYLSSDPQLGWVSAWVNGASVLSRVRPRSNKGLMPGTLYPGMPEVWNRSGLYRGCNGNTQPPRYRQWA